MSIQIANPGGKAERAEVVDRLAGLLATQTQASNDYTDEKDDKPSLELRRDEEVKSLFFALLGSYPTSEELGKIVGK